MDIPPKMFVSNKASKRQLLIDKKEVTWIMKVKRNRPVAFNMNLEGFAV